MVARGASRGRAGLMFDYSASRAADCHAATSQRRGRRHRCLRHIEEGARSGEGGGGGVGGGGGGGGGRVACVQLEMGFKVVDATAMNKLAAR